MTIGNENLAVRQHERYRCAMPVGLVMSPEHSDILRLSSSVVDKSNTIRAVMTDCSLGGLGLNTAIFFPKRARVVMTYTTEEGPAIELALRVMRVQMIDREPTYYLGMALVDPNDDTNATGLGRLIELAKAVPALGKETDRAGA
ncbi:MAG: PilZ domain-containing protein [Phycisphaerales bacterium]|nr:PilZ domain-containing protein [Phycisphaerales bacterium]